MARAELIPSMTDEQLDNNEEYARERAQNNPEQTFWLVLVELIQIQRQFNAKLAEYRETVGREAPAPTSPHRQ